jgi:hypothetical protein
MRTYPIDIDAGQLVRWLIEEQRTAPGRFRIAARHGAEIQEIQARSEWRMGDVEREDLSEVETVASLEIAPQHASDGWLLTVVVEDEAGPRLPEGGLAAGGEEINVQMFYSKFIRPGRGLANVEAEAADEAAEARIEQLISSVESNRHGPAETRPAR